MRLSEMDPAGERAAIRATIDRIEAASGTRPVGWLGAGLAETWNTLDYLAEAGIRYVCDWVNDDQPYLFEIGTPPLVSLPYSVQTNDVLAYFEMKVSVPEFEAMLKRQFDTLCREGETVPCVMAIAVHPFVTGQPHRIGALDAPQRARVVKLNNRKGKSDSVREIQQSRCGGWSWYADDAQSPDPLARMQTMTKRQAKSGTIDVKAL